MSTKQSRQEWVCDHPKRRRSFRVGRQAREKRKITGLLHSSVRSQTPGQGENHRPNQTIGDEGSQDDRTKSNVVDSRSTTTVARVNQTRYSDRYDLSARDFMHAMGRRWGGEQL